MEETGPLRPRAVHTPIASIGGCWAGAGWLGDEHAPAAFPFPVTSPSSVESPLGFGSVRLAGRALLRRPLAVVQENRHAPGVRVHHGEVGQAVAVEILHRQRRLAWIGSDGVVDTWNSPGFHGAWRQFILWHIR